MSFTESFRQTLLDHLTATQYYDPEGLYLALFEDVELTTELTSPAPDLTDPQNPVFPTGYYRQVVPLPDFDPGEDRTYTTSAVEFQIVQDVTVAAVALCGSDVVGTADVITSKAFATPLVLTNGQTVRFEPATVSLQLI